MKRIAIIGAGGFGREVAWLIEEINNTSPEWFLMGFLDDKVMGNIIEKYPVIGTTEYANELDNDVYFACAIGDPRLRKQLIEKLHISSGRFATLIHPSVKMSQYVTIQEGCIICANTTLTTNISIEKFSLLNVNCIVGHDSTLGEYTSCMPAVNIAGDVIVEEGCYFGLNACVINRKKVGAWSIIGAGAVVVKDIPTRSVAVGVPATPIKTIDE